MVQIYDNILDFHNDVKFKGITLDSDHLFHLKYMEVKDTTSFRKVLIQFNDITGYCIKLEMAKDLLPLLIKGYCYIILANMMKLKCNNILYDTTSRVAKQNENYGEWWAPASLKRGKLKNVVKP